MFDLSLASWRLPLVLLAGVALAACSDSDNDDNLLQFGDTWAVTTSNRLIAFNENNPAQPRRVVAVSGLQSGEQLLGIDFRPSTGFLYGLGSNNRLYRINALTGAATLASTMTADATDASAPFVALSGTAFGMDFNPTGPVALRIVSDNGQNLRVANPDVGNTFTDANLNGSANGAVAAAYTNSLPGASATTLFVIDAAGDRLHIQSPPNNGTLTTVGAVLGVDTSGVTGFDIDGVDGRALAALTVGSASQLYSINLTTGVATLLGTIGGGETIRGLTRVPSETTVFGVTDTNTLVSFAPSAPQTVSTIGAIAGLQGGEAVQALDFRPADGDLYALGGSGRIYRLSTSTGGVVATRVLAADPADASSAFTVLTGTVFGMDFNPVVNRLRVVSEQEQNLRINVDSSQGVTTDTNLTPAGHVAAAAYTNSFDGTTATQLLVIDTSDDMLKLQNPPNDGTLTTPLPLGVAAEDSALTAFDIAGGNNGIALAALRVGGQSNLYSVNLTTGAATQVTAGPIGGATPLNIRGIAIRLD